MTIAESGQLISRADEHRADALGDEADQLRVNIAGLEGLLRRETAALNAKLAQIYEMLMAERALTQVRRGKRE